jgi:hypothetical protein
MAADTRPWTRLQDWITTLAGAFLALSPLWFDVDTGGAWAMVIIGVVMAGLGLIALSSPGMVADEWLAMASGVAAFVAPWVFSYTGDDAAAWTSWIVGAVVVLSALAAVPDSRAVHHRQAAGHA